MTIISSSHRTKGSDYLRTAVNILCHIDDETHVTFLPNKRGEKNKNKNKNTRVTFQGGDDSTSIECQHFREKMKLKRPLEEVISHESYISGIPKMSMG